MRTELASGARRAAPVIALVAALAKPAAAQWDVGLGLGVADTHQNAVAVNGTLTRWLTISSSTVSLSLRGFADAELAIRDFKEGFAYDEPERHQITDSNGVPQPPNEQDLWQMRGWDAHFAAYVTASLPWVRFLNVGPGFAYNGLDAHQGLAWVLVVYVSSRAELDVEFLDLCNGVVPDPRGRWRGRLVLSFWSF